MWFEEIPAGKGWSLLWHNLTLCSCGGIRAHGDCSACGEAEVFPYLVEFIDESGTKHLIPPASMGAEGRIEDWLYLDLLQREWERPPSAASDGMLKHYRVSHHATVVLLFWTYFESRIERLLRLALNSLPKPLCEDFLSRYSSIGTRIDRLYRLLFDTTYFEDLRAVGAAELVSLLSNVQKQRNCFAHGKPGAIDDELVNKLVGALRQEHFAWIAVFNRRVAAMRRARRLITPPRD